MFKNKSTHTLYAALVLGFLSVLYSTSGVSMSILDAGKMCTFSSISGVILNDGEPVVGAKVVRTANHEKAQTDTTITDQNGYFEMPAMYVRSIAKYLPQQFVAGQSITVIWGGQETSIWRGVKMYQEENSESRGKPLVVTCDLQRVEKVITVKGDSFITRCDWDVEPDEDPFKDGGFFD